MATPNTSNEVKVNAKQANKDVQAMMAEMAAKVKGTVKQKSLPDDPAFSTEFPRLWAWVSATQIGESMEKDSARVVCSIEDSTCKATLSDNALRCSLSGVGLTFWAALGNLETLLGQKDAPWVTWKQRGKALRDILAAEQK